MPSAAAMAALGSILHACATSAVRGRQKIGVCHAALVDYFTGLTQDFGRMVGYSDTISCEFWSCRAALQRQQPVRSDDANLSKGRATPQRRTERSIDLRRSTITHDCAKWLPLGARAGPRESTPRTPPVWWIQNRFATGPRHRQVSPPSHARPTWADLMMSIRRENSPGRSAAGHGSFIARAEDDRGSKSIFGRHQATLPLPFGWMVAALRSEYGPACPISRCHEKTSGAPRTDRGGLTPSSSRPIARELGEGIVPRALAGPDGPGTRGSEAKRARKCDR